MRGWCLAGLRFHNHNRAYVRADGEGIYNTFINKQKRCLFAASEPTTT